MQARRTSRKTEHGFTIIEVIVSVFIFTVLSYGIVLLMSSLFTGYNKQSQLLSDTDLARKTATSFTNLLRGATTGSDGSYALNSAGDQQIIFFSDAGSLTVNRYRFFMSGTTLKEGVIVPSGNFYNPVTEVVTTVQTDLANGSSPVFYYYDGNFGGTGSQLAQPVNVTQVRFAKINLVITNKAGQTGAGNFTISSGAAVRNLKNNLGN